MITLYTSGPNFGLPDASPFVTKTEVLLKMSGLAYRTAPADFFKAPKGKIPYLDDGDRRLSDSTFIRWHLEKEHGVDFDKGLTAAEKAVAWAFEKMVEDHLYWAVVDSRWTRTEDFERGPKVFFKTIPAPVRPVAMVMARRSIKAELHGQGFGRHTRDEIVALATRDIAAISDHLGGKPWLMGETPCGTDATIWAFVASALCPHFDNEIRRAAEARANLVAYRDRGMARWYPELAAVKR